jgi:hypothetical protein
MPHTSRVAAAALAAVAFVISGVTVIGHNIPDQHWGTRGAVLDIAFAVGALAIAAALPAVAARLAGGRLGGIGTRFAQMGHVAIAVECVASTIHNGNTLGPVFVLGLLTSLVGLALVAIDGIRTGSARLLAPLPVLGLLVGIAGGNHGGAIALGAVWAVFALLIAKDDQRVTALLPAAG